MPTFNSMTELMFEAARLTQSNQGWTFLPNDDPEHAVLGMIGFRRLSPDGSVVTGDPCGPDEREEVISLEWLPYGKRLEPTVTIAKSLAEFRSMVNDLRPRGMFRCDEPKARQIGFVGYDGANGKATVVRMPMTLVKDVDEHDDFRMEIVIGSSLKTR